ncbi:hypothetical protein EBS02_09895 [bacterium]|nr:hypothetical protein [bacterium]
MIFIKNRIQGYVIEYTFCALIMSFNIDPRKNKSRKNRSMKFQLVSDLHLEFFKSVDRFPQIPVKAVYLLLAGDIGSLCHLDALVGFLKSLDSFKKVFYIFGNHEYYGCDMNKDVVEKIQSLQQRLPENVILLNKDSSIVSDEEKIRIVGCTLWCDYNPEEDPPINDEFRIRGLQKKRLYQDHLEFLQKELEKEEFRSWTTIILTHYLPSFELIQAKYKNNPYNMHYATHAIHSLSSYFPKNTKIYWCCGHSHGSVHKSIQEIECHMNAIGYPDEGIRDATLDFVFEADSPLSNPEHSTIEKKV